MNVVWSARPLGGIDERSKVARLVEQIQYILIRPGDATDALRIWAISRSRVGSASARSDFKVVDIKFF